MAPAVQCSGSIVVKKPWQAAGPPIRISGAEELCPEPVPLFLRGVWPMKRMLLASLTLMAVLGFSPGPRAVAQDKPSRLMPTRQEIEQALGTDWYGMYTLEKKSGYF